MAGRPTAEYLRLYALEGFLLRLSISAHRERFVLKGGVLLAAHDLRRPTTDVDVAALRTANDVEDVRRLVVEVAALAAPVDDGLVFDLNAVTAAAIRDEDEYAGVRVRLVAQLATAREPFHVDVNVGDPIWPAPAEVELPRLLEGDPPIVLRGYPVEMVVAEKVVTALQRGLASTRWRDFGDLYLLTGRVAFTAGVVREAIVAVAEYRRVELEGLDGVLAGYGEVGQRGWLAWRARVALTDVLPESFADVVAAVVAFADPVLDGGVADVVVWRPAEREWRG
ncbi:nucleotidyl transferase AbiEii/AbiGii toxin family protein [Jiangella rhizosphaerae]|uniref:Nucleotidyl transferase AbiEii/AbiGii toxin family protein n=2 Tax=Jiangella rhizosphaerae TaxID=2293569 RepID=A0A418KIV4_9ACTN|nr:nucleotidyl transferase AbiEii/AbiGii toxin family protein [Jiangella rhizosphaerae]